MKTRGVVAVLLAALAVPALAADKPSVARGKELFESTTLGTNGASCVECHPGGEKLKAAAGYDEEELREIINRCVTHPLQGKALDAAGPDMKSLIMYIRTFGR